MEYKVYVCNMHRKKFYPRREEWKHSKNLSDQSKTEAQQGKTQIAPKIDPAG